jgi:Ca2+-binding RTX toxin-like protein
VKRPSLVRKPSALIRVIALAGAIVAATAALPAVAAAEFCSYNATTKAVTATIDPGGNATLVVVGGALHFGAVPSACDTATTTNTNTVSISGSSGTLETLRFDESGGFLGPGEATETNAPEIEMTVALGDSGDEIVVIGTPGNDSIAAGANGLSLNADGDVDVTFAQLPAHIEIQARGGVNFLTGRGGLGAGLAFPGSLTLVGGDLGDELNGGNGNDVITGGAGNDTITGYAGGDQLTGAGGNDTLSGSEGNDTIVGGAGADNLLGGFDNDVLYANDDVADTQIHGGPGTDTAHVDAGIDPATIAVETVIPD